MINIYETIETNELEERLRLAEAEKEALETTIGMIENELFWRKHPETRPTLKER